MDLEDIDEGALDEIEEEFEPFIGRAKKPRSGAVVRAFVGQLRRVSGGYKLGSRRGGWGGSRAHLNGGEGTSPRSYFQRVSVKARFVIGSKGTQSKSIQKHIRYLQREGVSLDGGPGQAFSNLGNLSEEELSQIPKVWDEDRHHWRLIVSPESAMGLDFEAFARDYILGMEGDLGTKLSWFGVAHHNTDKPHLHLVIRGRRDDGTDLVIPRDYVSHGMRHLAEKILTERLGVRHESEIVKQLQGELRKDGPTTIDRVLFREARRKDWILDLRPKAKAESEKSRTQRELRIGRLKHLRELGLSREVRAGVWSISPESQTILRELGIKGDIIKTMHRELSGRNASEHIIYSPSALEARSITGRVIKRGVFDELSDKAFVIVEGVDGKSYFVRLGRYSENEGFEAREGETVTVSALKPKLELSKADRNILDVANANGGIYNQDAHRKFVAANITLPKHVSTQEYLDIHKKRIEALEKAKLVVQAKRGDWQIPPGFVTEVAKSSQRGRFSDDVTVQRECRWSLDKQASALGATWLDKQIEKGAKEERAIRSSFEFELRDGIHKRLQTLKSMGEADEISGQLIPKPGFIDRLYEQELLEAEKRLSADFGYSIRVFDREGFTGRVKEIESLPSGDHIVLVGEGKFCLVPLNKEMEKLRIGQEVRLDIQGPSMFQEPGVPRLKQVQIAYTKLRRDFRRNA